MSAPHRVVVVGHGIAGLTAADALRGAGHDGPITIVGDEPRSAYSRPALSKALLRDDADLTAHELPPADHGAEELLGVRATGLDVDARRVHLDDGEDLPYDALVVATGCRPRRLDGGRGADQLTLRTLDDAWQLRARVAERPTVVVIGGGPLGMEVASSCLDAGCDVTLVSLGEPLELQLGAHLASVFGRAARARGLRIVTSGATGIEPAPGGSRVRLGDGVVEAGLVVTAVGDLPNLEWLAPSGLLTGDALVVDGGGLVRPGIAAVGDVASVPTPYGVRRVPLWSAAIEQAKIAAATLVRGETPAASGARPYFWTEQFGLSLKAVGHLPLAGTPTVVGGDPATDAVLWRWEEPGREAAAALNYRIPIPRLRRLCDLAPAG